MREVLDELRSGGVGDDELEGAQNRARRGLVGHLSGFGDRADALAHAAVLRGDPHYINGAFDRYSAVDGSVVSRVAGEVLDPERLTSVHVVPEEAA